VLETHKRDSLQAHTAQLVEELKRIEGVDSGAFNVTDSPNIASSMSDTNEVVHRYFNILDSSPSESFKEAINTMMVSSSPALKHSENPFSSAISSSHEGIGCNDDLIHAISNELEEFAVYNQTPTTPIKEPITTETFTMTPPVVSASKFVHEIEEVYRVHNPAKLSSLSAILEKYRGREEVIIYY